MRFGRERPRYRRPERHRVLVNAGGGLVCSCGWIPNQSESTRRQRAAWREHRKGQST